MEAKITKRTILKEVYSASGLEYIQDRVYVIGDDSSLLYVYGTDGNLLKSHKLFDTGSKARLQKSSKPDLETLTTLGFRGINYLLTLGSGSKKDLREKGFLIHQDTFSVVLLNLSGLYEDLRNRAEVVGEKKLNIEGLASTENEILIFTRGNISGKNVLISYDLNNLLVHLIEKGPIPHAAVTSYDLPTIGSWLSGFSGATYSPINDYFLFTATVEVTSNEIDDGATLGSFVGIIENQSRRLLSVRPIMDKDQLYLGKVESISIVKEFNGKVIALAVTDSDGGESELIEIEITRFNNLME